MDFKVNSKMLISVGLVGLSLAQAVLGQKKDAVDKDELVEKAAELALKKMAKETE